MGRRGGEARAALGRHFPAPFLGRKSATQAPRSYGCHDAPGDNLVAWGPRAKSDARCRRLVWSGTASRPAGAGRRGREGGFRFSGVSVSVTGTKKRMSCAAMTESANESDDRSKKKSALAEKERGGDGPTLKYFNTWPLGPVQLQAFSLLIMAGVLAISRSQHRQPARIHPGKQDSEERQRPAWETGEGGTPAALVPPARETCLEGAPAASLGSRWGSSAPGLSAASLRIRSGMGAEKPAPLQCGRRHPLCVVPPMRAAGAAEASGGRDVSFRH